MSNYSRSNRLRQKLDLLRPALSDVGIRVLRHPCPREFYPKYIATMHGISRAAVPLMELAVSEVSAREKNDESAIILRAYWERHIPEETGHDEWALEDLEVIGVDRNAVLQYLPSPTIAALVGSQYYWIRHAHPVALMGYLAVMEANPPSPNSVEQLEARTGFPPEAFRSMRIHSQLDIKHEKDVFRVIDDLPIDRSMERLITVSAMHTTELLIQALNELVRDDRPFNSRLNGGNIS